MSVFDLPTAVLEIQRAFGQVEELKLELNEARQSEQEARLQQKLAYE
jgi:hypothetical protein